MKRIYLLLVFLLLVLSAGAQSDLEFMLNKEGRLTAIPRRQTYALNIPKFSFKSYTPSTTRELDARLRHFNPEAPTRLDERPMDMQILSSAYQPYFNVFAPMLRQVSPMALDFNEITFVPINDNWSVLVHGWQSTWPGVGGITSINPSLRWQSGAWTVSGGAFAGRYFTPFNASPGFMGGVNTHVSYQATDWLKLNTWAQYANYSTNEKNNPHMLLNPFYYHTNVGGSMEFKINDDFGFGVGMQYEFNPIKRKMEPQIFAFPAFH
ncbi:MAG: hypothetical protein RRZ65_09620 [Tannerellaceae bacterium]